MKVTETKIPGVLIIDTDVFGDHRGYFTETYSKPKYEKMGITVDFVQDNMSFSAQKGTLRGLHWQNPPYAQSKLVSCTKGTVIDVAVDIRKGSPTFGQWVSVELSEENHRQFFIPQGFAHGDWGSLLNGIEPVLSEKDQVGPTLEESNNQFVYEGE